MPSVSDFALESEVCCTSQVLIKNFKATLSSYFNAKLCPPCPISWDRMREIYDFFNYFFTRASNRSYTALISAGRYSSAWALIVSGTPQIASAMPPTIAPMVSLSPPTAMA